MRSSGIVVGGRDVDAVILRLLLRKQFVDLIWSQTVVVMSLSPVDSGRVATRGGRGRKRLERRPARAA